MGIPHQFKSRKSPEKKIGIVDPDLTEAPVVNAVAELLARTPHVLLAVRQNGGAFTYRNKAGRDVPVWMYKILKGHGPHCKITITDFWGLVFRVDRFVPFALECKRPGWTFDWESDREMRQREFIKLMELHGGIGGFVTNAEEAHAVLAQPSG